MLGNCGRFCRNGIGSFVRFATSLNFFGTPNGYLLFFPCVTRCGLLLSASLRSRPPHRCSFPHSPHSADAPLTCYRCTTYKFALKVVIICISRAPFLRTRYPDDEGAH